MLSDILHDQNLLSQQNGATGEHPWWLTGEILHGRQSNINFASSNGDANESLGLAPALADHVTQFNFWAGNRFLPHGPLDVGYNLSANLYDTYHQFDFFQNTFFVNKPFLLSEKTEAAAEFEHAYNLERTGTTFTTDGLTLSATRHEGKLERAMASAMAERRWFRFTQFNAWTYTGSGILSYWVGGSTLFSGGAQYQLNDAANDEFSYVEPTLSLVVSQRIGPKIAVDVAYDRHWRHYREIDSFFGERRRDLRDRVFGQLSYAFTPHLSAKMSYAALRNQSNLSADEFKDRLFLLGVSGSL